MQRILVTGVGELAGYNTALILSQRGYIVIGTDVQPVSIEGIRCYVVSPAGDIHFLDQLHAIACAEKIDLLIPTVAEELEILSSNSAEWDIPIAVASFSAVHVANDKYLTSQYLSAAGVAVPRYALPSQVDSPASLSKKVGWPCLSKPRVGHGGQGVVVHTEADWPLLQQMDDSRILQEFIPGADYAPELYLGRKGQSVVTVFEKNLIVEGFVGNVMDARPMVVQDVAGLAVSAGRALGFLGPLDVDIRRRAEGEPVVLEIDAHLGINISRAPAVLDALLADNGIY